MEQTIPALGARIEPPRDESDLRYVVIRLMLDDDSTQTPRLMLAANISGSQMRYASVAPRARRHA
jgi:hypothetical protein